MDITAFSSVIGSMLSAASILFAIYTFRKNEDRISFGRFRLGLVDFRHLSNRINQELSEPVFTEVAQEITNEIKQLLPENATPADLKNILFEEKHQNYLRQAIHTGLRKAPALKSIEDMIEKLDKLSVEFSEQFPIVSSLISDLGAYLKMTAKGILSPKAFNHALCNSDNSKIYLKPELEKIDSIGIAYREVALYLGSYPSNLLDSGAQETIDDTLALIMLLVGTFSALSDSELRVQSNLQKTRTGELVKLTSDTPIENAYECFKMVKHLFEGQWDQIVARKTRILSRTTKSQKPSN